MDTTNAASTQEAAALAAPFNAPPSAQSLLPSAAALTESIEWISKDEAVVTWTLSDAGPPIVTLVTVELDEQWIADGDAPRAVLAKVEDEAADRLDYDEDVDRDDGFRYAGERYYGGEL